MPTWLLFHPRSIGGALYGLMTNLHRARTQTGARVASSVPSELGSYFFARNGVMYKRKNRPAHESKWIPGVLSRKSSVIVGGCRLAGGGGGRGW